MSHRPHTVGEVRNEIIDISMPANPHDIHAGRRHDGLRIALYSTSLDYLEDESLTPQTLGAIRRIVSMRNGHIENMEGVLAFLDAARMVEHVPGRISKTVNAVSTMASGAASRLMAMLPSRKAIDTSSSESTVNLPRDDDRNDPESQIENAFEAV